MRAVVQHIDIRFAGLDYFSYTGQIICSFVEESAVEVIFLLKQILSQNLWSVDCKRLSEHDIGSQQAFPQPDQQSTAPPHLCSSRQS